MKKILVLMLVLGIASMATAGLTFTDNSTISSSATLSLDIAAADATGYEFYLVSSPLTVGTIGAGTVILGNISFDKTTYYPTYYLWPNMGYAGLNPASDSANYGFIGDAGGIPLNGTASINIAFTMAGTGYIDLYTSTDGMNYAVADSILVIPEPITMALLGLGGLFLRRRK